MGLIEESKNVDSYVIDTPWTEKEKEEPGASIKIRKEILKKSDHIATPTQKKKQRSEAEGNLK